MSQDGPINNLPDDILQYHILRPFIFSREVPIPVVAKRWHQLQEKNALEILTGPERQHLSLEKMIQLIFPCQVFSDKFSLNESLVRRLDPFILAKIAEANRFWVPGILRLIENMNEQKKIIPDGLYEILVDSIISAHPSLIQEMIDEGESIIFLKNSLLISLGKHKLAFAQTLINQKNLYLNLHKSDLIELGVIHLEIAQGMLQNDELCTLIGIDGMTELALKHPTIAEMLFNNNELRPKLENNHVLSLAKKYINFAQSLDENLLKTFYGFQLANLGSTHLFIAKKIRQTPYLSEKLESNDWAKLGTVDSSIGLDILRAVALDVHGLATLGAAHFSIAKTIMEDINLRKRFFSNCFSLAKMGVAHLPIALEIISDPMLRKTIMKEPKALAMLGQAHLSIALTIINDESLSNILSSDGLSEVGESHPAAAEAIMGKDKLRRKLDKYDLQRILNAFPAVAEQFIDKLKTDPQDNSRAIAAIELSQAIHQTALALRQTPVVRLVPTSRPFV